MATVRAFAAADASIAQGIAYDDSMGDDIRVTRGGNWSGPCAQKRATGANANAAVPVRTMSR